MATTTTTRTAAGTSGKYCERGVFCDAVTYTAAALTFAAADVIQMIRVDGANSPGGITVIGIDLYASDCGTVTAHVGDGTSTAWAMNTVDLGTTAGIAYRMGQGVTQSSTVGFPRLYTTNDTIDLTSVAITGTLTGTITMVVWMIAGPIS